MKPRILIFSLAYEPLVGGAELAVRNITDRLFDYEFDMITCRFDPKHRPREKIGNVTVYRVGFGSRLGRYLFPVAGFFKVAQLHKAKPYGMIWSIMAAYAGGAALLFKWRFPRVKFLLTLQEGDSVKHIYKQVRGFQSLWRMIFRKADYIQAISNFLADWAKKEGASCPIEVVPNGVNLEKFKANDAKKNANDAKVVITVSRLVYKNGVDILIRAIQDLPVKLQILGSGPEETSLKNLAEELNIADKIEFLGNIDNDKLPEYLSQADIFARPSRSEGLGISFLEAMAMGLPVIAPPVGGIPDFLKDRETGLFVQEEDPADLAEKIKLLLNDESLRNRIAQAGQKLVLENYSWGTIASKMDRIFKKLASHV